MPSKHDRIAVINDLPLQEALERVTPLMNGETRPARLVHDLAIKGAQAVLAEQERRRWAAERMIAWVSGDEQPPWDPEVLGRVRELAWPAPDQR